MEKHNELDWQKKILQAASEMRYPPTPDVTSDVLQRISAQKALVPGRFSGQMLPKRWLATALALFLVLVLALSLVPGVRAQIQEFLQIGPLRIFFTNPTAPSTPLETQPFLPASLFELAGRVTLSEASSRWQYPLRQPAYPPDLGAPDLVFLQGPVDEALILAWLDPAAPDQVFLALQALAPGDSLYSKSAPASVEQTTVNGEVAYWIVGEHLLEMRNGDYSMFRLVEGHVLTWTSGVLTYRLETDLSLEEAVRIAESLR
jgi:hypothetical protein